MDEHWRWCPPCLVWWWGPLECWVCGKPGKRQRPQSFGGKLAELVGYLGVLRSKPRER